MVNIVSQGFNLSLEFDYISLNGEHLPRLSRPSNPDPVQSHESGPTPADAFF